MKGICVLPSFNRAERLKSFFQSYRDTESTVPGLVFVDKDDPQKEQYTKLDYPGGWRLVLTESRKMGSKFRETFEQYKDYDYVTVLNDDHYLMTKNWDEKLGALINGHNVIATNDGRTPDKPWNAPQRLCGAITISGPIVRALGYLIPGEIEHFYSDDVWGLLFERARCYQFAMDICCYHDHAYLDPSKRDATFFAVNGNADYSSQRPSGGYWDADRAAFEKWLGTSAETDAQKVIDLQPRTGCMIATPTHDGNVAMAYALGLADTAAFFTQQNFYFEIARVEGSSLIPHARNSLVDMFLKSRCQKLLFMDADQGFSRDVVWALLNSNRRIIAGITPHKRFPLNANFEPLEKDYSYFKSLTNKGPEELQKFFTERADAKGEIEVSKAGCGVMMIDRTVFEIMRPHVNEYLAFDDRLDAKHGEYFWMGSEKESGRFRGEDWSFTILAKKLKIPIYINTRAMVPHRGHFTFSFAG